MFRKLFLRKSKEALSQVETAEKILEAAQQKINDLKSTDKFTLLREEMIRLIKQSNELTYDMQRSMYINCGDAVEISYKRDNVLSEINQCLDEMEGLAKEKD